MNVNYFIMILSFFSGKHYVAVARITVVPGNGIRVRTRSTRPTFSGIESLKQRCHSFKCGRT